MSQDDYAVEVVVLLTGFGPFLDVKNNPSWEIVSRLPNRLSNNYPKIRIITQEQPLGAAYHEIFDTVPKLLEQHAPDIVIHIGLAAEQDYFAIEKSAERDGYCQIPDMARRVFTKAETKAKWGKSPETLQTALDIKRVLAGWKTRVKGAADVRVSDDVGTYVCGFVYYLSLEWFQKQRKPAHVLFLHVPLLPSVKDIDLGVKVTTDLITAVVESI